MPGYDTIIAGAGAAGCVLAARLTEDPDRTVLLVEAGPSDLGVAAIKDAAQWTSLLGGPYDWNHVYAPSDATLGRSIPIPRGRVLGGSSSINAMLWYRGHPSDYDRWAMPGWDFASILPYFRRSEDYEGGADHWRGAGGPMRIERPHDPHPVARAMLDAAPAIGLPVIGDANAASNEGACLANFNMRGPERWSTARAYLHPAMHRPNLTVLTDAPIHHLAISNGRCTGIVHAAGQTTHADNVILCSGAIASPVLLLRSGVGLPGIGDNLQDHPLVMGVNFHARYRQGPISGNGGGSMMNWRSRDGLPGPDLHAFIVQGPHSTGSLDPDCFAISPGLMRSESRGTLRLHGEHLEIQPNFLQDPADVQALMRGVETCMDLAATPAFAHLTAGPALPPRRLGAAELEQFVRAHCSTFFHPCGTCSMGIVVDAQLRVHGIANLRIADASVIPHIPSCNTQAPVIMIAERAADMIRGRPC